MATQVQFRRGTAAQNNSFTGGAGEGTCFVVVIDDVFVHVVGADPTKMVSRLRQTRKKRGQITMGYGRVGE